MHHENSKEAISLLHQAVPLMMKLRISPTPYNYAIWYEYVSNRNSQLNALMDQTIRKLGSLPNFISKELFHEFILDDDIKFNPNHKDKLEQVIENIGNQSNQMDQNLQRLNASLEKSQRVLNRPDRGEHIEKVIQLLEKSTSKASQQTQEFQSALNTVQSEIAALKAEIHQAKNNVELDPLTGLLNLTGLERHIYTWIEGAEDDLSILLIDIDDLGSINNTYGRRTGTSIIRYLGQYLQEKEIENAVVARITGGTFAILINEATLDYSSKLAESIRREIEKQVLRSKMTQQSLSSLTVSIGVVTLMGQELGETLLSRAQLNLRNAKRKGRNRIATH